MNEKLRIEKLEDDNKVLRDMILKQLGFEKWEVSDE